MYRKRFRFYYSAWLSQWVIDSQADLAGPAPHATKAEREAWTRRGGREGPIGHTSQPGLGDLGSLLTRCLFNQTFFSPLETEPGAGKAARDTESKPQAPFCLPKQLGPRLASSPIKLTSQSQVRRQHLPVVTQTRESGRSHHLHPLQVVYRSMCLCYFTFLGSRKLKRPPLRCVSVQDCRPVDFLLDLARPRLRFFPLSGLPRQLKKNLLEQWIWR